MADQAGQQGAKGGGGGQQRPAGSGKKRHRKHKGGSPQQQQAAGQHKGGSPQQEQAAGQHKGGSPQQQQAAGQHKSQEHQQRPLQQQQQSSQPTTQLQQRLTEKNKETMGAGPASQVAQIEAQVQGTKGPVQLPAHIAPPDSQGSEGAPQKTKAQLKAERRAVQEAQRAAKAGKKGPPAGKKENDPSGKRQDSTGSSKDAAPRVPDHVQLDQAQVRKKMAKKLEKQQVPQRSVAQKKVGLFSHLHQYERDLSLTKDIQFSSCSIHPSILKLGLQYAEGVICGSNARCIALLAALKQVIIDYSTPPQKELSRDLDARIKPYISFLTQCRPLSVSMGNAIKYLKWHINHIPRETRDTEAKVRLNEAIDQYLKEKILLAGEAISKEYANTKIKHGDVILVYACSSLIRKVLCDAHDMGKKFCVVVVDGRPKLEGQEMLRRLVKHGIKCSYVLINAASYIMKQVTKVFLGAHALLANGSVMSRVGNSQIAMIAKAFNVPVLVCCETYKFCERVQTDSFVFNELGDPADLVSISKNYCYLDGWKDLSDLSVLNLVYDVTPHELITMVITEVGMVPCTSVPVVLRVKHAETEA